jgi:hypothetical protein
MVRESGECKWRKFDTTGALLLKHQQALRGWAADTLKRLPTWLAEIRTVEKWLAVPLPLYGDKEIIVDGLRSLSSRESSFQGRREHCPAGRDTKARDGSRAEAWQALLSVETPLFRAAQESVLSHTQEELVLTLDRAPPEYTWVFALGLPGLKRLPGNQPKPFDPESGSWERPQAHSFSPFIKSKSPTMTARKKRDS